MHHKLIGSAEKTYNTSEQSPAHTYTKAGNYKLVITNSKVKGKGSLPDLAVVSMPIKVVGE